MKNMMFFDSNARIGSPCVAKPVYAPEAADLLKEMDRHGIDKALIREVNTEAAGAAFANRRIAEQLKNDDSGRLCGVWSMLPPHTHELPEGPELFHLMKESKIKAWSLNPAAHGWIVSRFSIGGIMAEAAIRKIPVLISPEAIGGWDKIYELLEMFPENIYICLTTRLYWGSDRMFRPLLDQYPGFHVEISTYWVPEGVGDLVSIYGAKKIMYGSGYPDFGHGSMMLALKHAEISDAEKQMIASGNLERLLNEVQL